MMTTPEKKIEAGMRAHYFQHVSFEGLGSIEAWLDKAGAEISSTRFFDDAVLPSIEDIDFLIVMGGPMSVNNEDSCPWLLEEKEFIKSAIGSGKPVLGICLGAQLIASSMGAEVFPNPAKEIGWSPVKAVESARASVFGFPEEKEVFHWHGETFSLPQGAVRIAESNACRNQAFQLGRNVLGLQFHLETTPSTARALVDHCRHEIVQGEFIQSEPEILSAPDERYRSINGLMARVLEYLLLKD